VVVEERRIARVGTVSGLALLAGGTAVAAASGGGEQSVFATVLLGLLTAGLGHALSVEIKRQAHRRHPPRWSRTDTVNTVLLGAWAELSLMMAILDLGPGRIVCLALALAYAAACGHFVIERRRAIKVGRTQVEASTEVSASVSADSFSEADGSAEADGFSKADGFSGVDGSTNSSAGADSSTGLDSFIGVNSFTDVYGVADHSDDAAASNFAAAASLLGADHGHPSKRHPSASTRHSASHQPASHGPGSHAPATHSHHTPDVTRQTATR
jgi:hypothetical protein